MLESIKNKVFIIIKTILFPKYLVKSFTLKSINEMIFGLMQTLK